MAGFDIPAERVGSPRTLALVVLLAAAVCVAGLLIIGFRGEPAAVLKQGQSIGFTAGRR